MWRAILDSANDRKSGVIRLARTSDGRNGSNNDRAVTPSILRDAIQSAGNVRDAIDARVTALAPAPSQATTGALGLVRLAVNIDDSGVADVPTAAVVKAAIAGGNITVNNVTRSPSNWMTAILTAAYNTGALSLMALPAWPPSGYPALPSVLSQVNVGRYASANGQLPAPVGPTPLRAGALAGNYSDIIGEHC